MEKIVTIVLAALLAALLAAIAFFAFSNPINANRKALAATIAEVKPIEVLFEKPNWDFDKWQRSIAGKPSLWHELVEPPPPPAPPPPPPEQPPNLEALIKDVTAGRQQIGAKIKIMKPGDTKGSFMAVGDELNGLKIKEITKTSVVLSMEWKGQELTTTITRK